MNRLLIFVSVCVLSTTLMYGYQKTPFVGNTQAHRHAKFVEKQIKRVGMRRRTLHVTSHIIRFSVYNLRRKGHHSEANKIWKEWISTHKRQLSNYLINRDLGDHKPVSIWLATVHDTLLLLLGEEAFRYLHLDDIRIINYALPVVFNPCDTAWDKAEYNLHFSPLTGVIGYWATFIGCMYGSLGTLWSIACEPGGTMVETILLVDLAPALSDFVYDISCNENQRHLRNPLEIDPLGQPIDQDS